MVTERGQALHGRDVVFLLRTMTLRVILGLSSVAFVAAAAAPEAPHGDATVRAKAGASEIVITTSSRVAGAIHSLAWNGREFIDSFDHGRQLQSASNLDFGSPIRDETFNPTEAGCASDGTGGTSSSRLLHLRWEAGALQTVTQMAFWLAPGARSVGNVAKNTRVLSDHLLTKRVRLGFRGLPHVIAYDVTYTLPIGERHTRATFEALTGYMPPEFHQFEQIDPATGALQPLSDGPGEGLNPIVFSVREGTHAMGIYAPPQAAEKIAGPTYGRFRFAAERVVKWNCVFRATNDDGLEPGEYTFRMFVIVGDPDTVCHSMQALHRMFADGVRAPGAP